RNHLLLARHRLAVVLRQHRFRIEGIDLRGSAVEKEKDYVLGAGGEVAYALALGGHGPIGHSGKSRYSKTGAGKAQHNAAIHISSAHGKKQNSLELNNTLAYSGQAPPLPKYSKPNWISSAPGSRP